MEPSGNWKTGCGVCKDMELRPVLSADMKAYAASLGAAGTAEAPGVAIARANAAERDPANALFRSFQDFRIGRIAAPKE